jgi:hypothetical protein
MMLRANMILAVLAALILLGNGVRGDWDSVAVGVALLAATIAAWRGAGMGYLAAAWGWLIGGILLPAIVVFVIADQFRFGWFFFGVLPAIFAAAGLLLTFFGGAQNAAPMGAPAAWRRALGVASAVVAIVFAVPYAADVLTRPGNWLSGLTGAALLIAAAVALFGRRMDFLAAIQGFLVGRSAFYGFGFLHQALTGMHPAAWQSLDGEMVLFCIVVSAALFAAQSPPKQEKGDERPYAS